MSCVDRKNRDCLVDAIYRYLSEKITAYEFEDEIREIGRSSDDPAVVHAADVLSCYCDDCDDHTVVLSKEGWDHFYRVILLLKSNARLEIETRRRWSTTQIGAAVSLAVFGGYVGWLGVGFHLLAVAVPLGVVSILLSFLHRRFLPRLTPLQRRVIPFSLVSEYLAVRRSVGGFIKHRYPLHLQWKLAPSELMKVRLTILCYAPWVACSPLVLFIQLFPYKETRTRVQMSP